MYGVQYIGQSGMLCLRIGFKTLNDAINYVNKTDPHGKRDSIAVSLNLRHYDKPVLLVVHE